MRHRTLLLLLLLLLLFLSSSSSRRSRSCSRSRSSSSSSSKNHLPGAKQFQNHAKKRPNVSSEILEKQHFSRDSVGCGC